MGPTAFYFFGKINLELTSFTLILHTPFHLTSLTFHSQYLGCTVRSFKQYIVFHSTCIWVVLGFIFLLTYLSRLFWFRPLSSSTRPALVEGYCDICLNNDCHHRTDEKKRPYYFLTRAMFRKVVPIASEVHLRGVKPKEIPGVSKRAIHRKANRDVKYDDWIKKFNHLPEITYDFTPYYKSFPACTAKPKNAHILSMLVMYPDLYNQVIKWRRVNMSEELQISYIHKFGKTRDPIAPKYVDLLFTAARKYTSRLISVLRSDLLFIALFRDHLLNFPIESLIFENQASSGLKYSLQNKPTKAEANEDAIVDAYALLEVFRVHDVPPKRVWGTGSRGKLRFTGEPDTARMVEFRDFDMLKIQQLYSTVFTEFLIAHGREIGISVGSNYFHRGADALIKRVSAHNFFCSLSFLLLI
eukprot:GHVR01113344.1.p1 GENE.GHVR01113344.1~~GHVR01113344.1.p1  ORF type:complete len:413 (-),score=4.54 GHVR01113344.1:2545-3783(-)